MRYLLNMTEIEKRMKIAGIRSISQLWRESGLDPRTFFVNQNRNKNMPKATLNVVYCLSKRLDCRIEDIMITKK